MNVAIYGASNKPHHGQKYLGHEVVQLVESKSLLLSVVVEGLLGKIA
jgi:hypothetical protein